MKMLLLTTVLILSGCSTAPVVMKFPEVPEALMQQCEPLDKVPADT